MLIGFAPALALARGVSDPMFGVQPDGLRVCAAVGLLPAAVAVDAMSVPAIRAATIHPLEPCAQNEWERRRFRTMTQHDDERTAMRRRDRAMADESGIRALLHEAATGVLATVEDGQPFLNSNLFAYDEEEHAIWMHTAATGRTRANIDAEERVCFTAFEMGRLLPADEALEFSVEYAGVVVFGHGRVATGQDEARRALQLLLDKYFPDLEPGRDYRPITDDELRRTAVYRIDIEAWSGKRKTVEEDFAGARSWWDRRMWERDGQL